MFKDYTTREQRLKRTDRLDKDLSIWEFVLMIVLAIVIADVLGAMAWVLSGQTPITDWYMGKYTLDIIRLII